MIHIEVAVESRVGRKWTKRRKSLLRILIAALLILGILLFAIYTYVSRSLPQITGEVIVPGVKNEVEVIRDENGVPHITAANESDLYFAQGYVQAQDRLFQMDLSRRQASGRLSEVIGEASINNDKYFRTLGLRRAARDSYEHYSEEAKQHAQSFSNGVNAYIDELRDNGRWPVEFTILGYKPEAWSPIDSLVIGKFMAYDLGGHWESQVFRYYLLQHFPKEKAYDLYPSIPEEIPDIVHQKELDIEKAFATAIVPPESNGSNNWVVSGKKSKSGLPLLANDPHLSLGTPSIWYQMHLRSPEVNVSGVIFTGIPGIILGHNEHVAWGVTNTGPDVQDVYIEKRNPEDPTQFLYDDEWEKATIIDEPIAVKGEKTIPYKVTKTRHGPIISEFAENSGEDTVLSLQWTALEPSIELEAILKMNKASNWKQFEKALEDFHTPAQNFVFADREGTIAFKANGKIPIRKKGNGLLPVPGWTSDYEWIDYIPFDELPTIVNPKKGFVSTANDKIMADDYKYHIGHDWAQSYRDTRIKQFLKEKATYDIEDMQKLQMDQMNLQAEEFVPILLANLADPVDEASVKAVSYLEDWDFVDDKDGVAPLVFHRWMERISSELFTGHIPENVLELFHGRKKAVDALIREAATGHTGPWVEQKGGLTKLVTAAFDVTMRELIREQGVNVDRWKWGKVHRIQFSHPLSAVKPLQYVFNLKRALPVGGSSVTVQAAAQNEVGIVDHGAAWRYTIDMNDTSTSYHLLGPGQSGQVLSPWYQNQMHDWVSGTYHPTKLNETDGERLRLIPE